MLILAQRTYFLDLTHNWPLIQEKWFWAGLETVRAGFKPTRLIEHLYYEVHHQASGIHMKLQTTYVWLGIKEKKASNFFRVIVRFEIEFF